MKSGGIQLGEVSFDPQTRELTDASGQPVQLRHKSKAVLQCLLENPGQVVTKDALMAAVWPRTTVSDESLVQCVADIRRVIGAEARKVVETVPREGYRINVGAPAEQAPSRILALAIAAGLALLAIGGWVGLNAWQSPPPAPMAAAPAGETPPGTANTEAYLEVLKGRASATRFSLTESLAAERHFRRAIDLDPDYARAYAELGTLLAVRFENDWTVLQEADQEKALFYAETAAALEPDLWLAHYALGRLHSVFGALDLAETHLERAMSLEPGNEDARAYLGILRNFQGDATGAVAILDQAVQSHPDPPYWYYLGLGNALFNNGRSDAAEAALTRCLELSRQSAYCLRYLIAVYGDLGRIPEATAKSRTYASMGFEPTISAIMDVMGFHHPSAQARLEDGLRRAGLPE